MKKFKSINLIKFLKSEISLLEQSEIGLEFQINDLKEEN